MSDNICLAVDRGGGRTGFAVAEETKVGGCHAVGAAAVADGTRASGDGINAEVGPGAGRFRAYGNEWRNTYVVRLEPQAQQLRSVAGARGLQGEPGILGVDSSRPPIPSPVLPSQVSPPGDRGRLLGTRCVASRAGALDSFWRTYECSALCGVGCRDGDEMGKLRQSPRERRSPGPEAACRVMGATGEAVVEEMSGKAGSDSDSTAGVVATGGSHFAEVLMGVEVFMEAAVLVEVMG